MNAKNDRINNLARSRRLYNLISTGHMDNPFTFFITPKLRFSRIEIHELLDFRWGKLIEDDESFFPKRRFVNITIKNDGFRLASNCKADVRVLNKTNGCTWLSTDDKKTLTWQNGEIITSIKPRGGDGILCIAFSQERLTKEQHDLIDSVKCAMVNDNVRCTAWVGTKRALERTAYADQDGMCQGNFIIHVDVISDTGNKVSKHFKITVGNEWHTLNAEMQECDCIIG